MSSDIKVPYAILLEEERRLLLLQEKFSLVAQEFAFRAEDESMGEDSVACAWRLAEDLVRQTLREFNEKEILNG